MFSLGSFEVELAQSMEKTLVTSQLENKYSFDKVAKAADYINAAAELLDDTGFSTEAKLLTKVIERLAAEEVIELSDEDLEELLQGKKPVSDMSIEEIVTDPFEQEISVSAPKGLKKINPYDGSIPLTTDPTFSRIMEEPKYISVAALAEKLQQKYAKKKV